MFEFHRPLIKLSYLLFLFTITLGSTSWALTGAAMPEEEQLQETATFDPLPMAESVHVVDLSNKMPPIGYQTMNDCTAWALARVKSYHEALDQGWKPDTPNHIFSPRFIYNQINRGKDKGSSPILTAKLLYDVGAATLQTCPYIPKDYLTPPTELALGEAKQFKIRDIALLKNIKQIHLALEQNEPVIIGARITPAFFSGNFDIYDAKRHAKSMKERDESQPHAKHAMVIVGFDDEKKAFLIANSWSKYWGRHGYCWVSYDVMENIDTAKSSESFLFLAMVMFDIQQNVHETPGEQPRVKDDRMVRWGYEHAGYDVENKKHNFRYYLQLRGSVKQLKPVIKVQWTVPTSKGHVQLTSENPEQYFRVWSSTQSAFANATALITLRNGQTHTQKVALSFTPPTARERDLKLIYNDIFSGKNNHNVDVWQMLPHIQGNETDLSELASVTYSLDAPAGAYSPRTFEADRWPFSFEGTLFTGKPYPVKALLQYKDGSQSTLRIEVDKFNTQAFYEPRIEFEHRAIGPDQPGYAYSVWMNMPGMDQPKVDYVQWELDGSQNFRQSKESYGTFFKPNMLTGYATREFRVKGTVHYYPEYKRKPVTREAWITLPEDAKYPNPDRIGIISYDQYSGRSKRKEPTWLIINRLIGDPKSIAKIKSVKQTYVDSSGKTHELNLDFKAVGEHLVWQGNIHTTNTKIQVKTTVTFKDGHVTELSDEIQASAKIIDDVYLSTRQWQPFTRTDGNYTDVIAGDWQTQIHGTGRIASMEKVAWVYDCFDHQSGGYQHVQRDVGPVQMILNRQRRQITPQLYLNFGARDQSKLSTRIYYFDGQMELFSQKLSAQKQISDFKPEEGRVVATEYFYGPTLNAKNTVSNAFIARFELNGSPEFLQRVTQWELQVQYDNGGRGKQHTFEPERIYKVYFNEPRTYISTIHFKDGSTKVTEHPLTCLAERHHDLSIKSDSGMIYLAGPSRMINDIKNVSFRITDLNTQKVSTHNALSYLYHGPRYGITQTSNSPLDIAADITFKDGMTRQIQSRYTPFQPTWEQTAKVALDYWGTYENKPHWLSSFTMSLPFEKANVVTTSSFNRAGTMDAPIFQILQVVPFVTDPTVYMEMKPIKDWRKFVIPVPNPPKQLDTFQLIVEQTHEGQNGLPNEWTARLQAPWAMLNEVKKVGYAFYSGSDRRVYWTDQRFSLDARHFPAYYFGKKLDKVITKFHVGDQLQTLSIDLLSDNPNGQ
ncbi:MAG: hypothetical protein CMJ19_00360 [Phycisphaeraceae bacterium]|nr:hypothetical protein [Phycisphaeraceae bacterium]